MIGGRTRVSLPEGWQLIVYDTVNSTSAEAKRLANITTNSNNTVLVIRADVQTDGHGRDSKTWYSPAGNLHFSVLFLKPKIQPSQFVLASLLASVAVVEGIAETAPALRHKLSCKWPNDVLCNRRKLCGILPEGAYKDGRLVWLVIGIGINVAHAPDAAIVQYPTTSLALEGVQSSIQVLMSAVCHQIALWLLRWQMEGFSPVRSRWLARASDIGSTVTAQLDPHHNIISGIFLGLDHDGALLLERAGGIKQRVLTGEIFY